MWCPCPNPILRLYVLLHNSPINISSLFLQIKQLHVVWLSHCRCSCKCTSSTRVVMGCYKTINMLIHGSTQSHTLMQPYALHACAYLPYACMSMPMFIKPIMTCHHAPSPVHAMSPPIVPLPFPCLFPHSYVTCNHMLENTLDTQPSIFRNNFYVFTVGNNEATTSPPSSRLLLYIR